MNYIARKMKGLFKYSYLKIYIAILIFLPFLSSCHVQQVIKDKYSNWKHSYKGNYYLDNKKYNEGIKVFREELRNYPDSAEGHYYMGRFQLAENHIKKAQYHLKQATKLAPDEADYYFWLGVVHATNKNKDLERQCYLKALELDNDHVQALTYIGHIQFEKSEFHKALKNYNRVLELNPDNPSALYNRGLILKRFKRTPEEKLAWKEYLAYFPTDSMARQAVHHLNALGDFSYRNYLIGKRTVTLRKIYFEHFSSKIWESSYPSLDVLGSILNNNRSISICIVAYQKNNKKLAEERAKSIKKYLLRNFPEIKFTRFLVSWFDVCEKIKIGKKQFKEEESINFFTALKGCKVKNTSSKKTK